MTGLSDKMGQVLNEMPKDCLNFSCFLVCSDRCLAKGKVSPTGFFCGVGGGRE